MTTTATKVLEYVVGRDGRIHEIRGAWDDFASANAAPHLTTEAVLDRMLPEFITDPGTRAVYAALCSRARSHPGPVSFPYRCDGPAVRRFMEMRLVPLDEDRVLFRSVTLREEPRDEQILLRADVPRSAETVLMCGWCKKVRGPAAWAEVEDWVRDSDILTEPPLPRISHGMCPECRAEMDARIDALG